MESIYFSMQTKVYFERGGITKYLPLVKNYGNKAFVVTGKKSVFESGLLQKITNICSQNGITSVLYPEVNPEPDISDVEKGAEICREEKCDVVVGIGGGSAMDVAKAVAVLSTNGGSLQNYFGEVAYQKSPLPVVAVPTTCGTGSEVTRFAVIMDKHARTKKTVSSEQILPKLSILDADTLETLPYHLVVATGMDAFAHSAESFLSTKADYISQMFARESLQLLWNFLPQVTKDRNNTYLKEKILLASLLAGFAINRTGTIIVHGMGYALTVKYHTHHGTANALLLPYVFEYLKKNGYENELAELEKIWVNIEHLKSFIKELGLPSKLSELGIAMEEIEELTELSLLGTQRAVNNMKGPLGVNEYRQMLINAL